MSAMSADAFSFHEPLPAHSHRRLPRPPGIPLRDYQNEAVDAVLAAHERGVQRPLVSLPTGTGKTLCFAELIRRRRGRALVLAHREELLEQAAAKVRMVIPDADIGIVKAARDEVYHDIVVGSVQTLAQAHRLERAGGFRTVVVDEAHHATAATWQRIIDGLGGFAEGGPLVCGVTATPARADKAALGAVWEEVVYERGLEEMIRLGYLCDLRAVRVGLDMDLGKVKRRGGDFEDEALAAAMHDANAPEHAVAAYQQHAAGLKALVFTPNVALAYEMAAAFQQAGIPSAALDGDTPKDQRKDVLKRYARGDLLVLANCALLTEGYDEPSIQCLIMGRPTQSAPTYLQMLGRGTRTFPGKDDCLILDLVGNTRHGIQTAADLFGVDPAKLSPRERLTEAQERQRQEEEAVPAGGVLVASAVDLFARRSFHWSGNGDLFVLPGGEVQIVLRRVPDMEARWEVVQLQRGHNPLKVASDLDLEYAQGIAEDMVRRMGNQHLSAPDADWRARTATDGQRDALRQRGMRPPARLTRGEAADMLGLVYARMALATATDKQRWLLRQLGAKAQAADPSLTKREASQLIDELKR